MHIKSNVRSIELYITCRYSCFNAIIVITFQIPHDSKKSTICEAALNVVVRSISPRFSHLHFRCLRLRTVPFAMSWRRLIYRRTRAEHRKVLENCPFLPRSIASACDDFRAKIIHTQHTACRGLTHKDRRQMLFAFRRSP